MTENIVKLEPKTAPKIPEFITRHDIEAMTDDEHDAMIAAIRVRRMQSHAVYQKTKQEKIALEQSKVKDKIEKKCEQVIKKLNLIDKHMDDLEKFINELRGLRLQADMELI